MEIKKIGVLGAGKMGTSIALSAAITGYQVILQDRKKEDLEKALNNIRNQAVKLVKKNNITAEESRTALNRIETTYKSDKFNSLDFIIEVVPESLEIKIAVLKQIDDICKKDAIIATGTSTFSITTLAAATTRPAQFAGMHFFIPPSKLVEIIRGHSTSDSTIEIVTEIAKKMGKIPVEVKKDSPGFIANRIYAPLFLEAFRVYEDGIASKEDIDLAMKNSYLPIGPFELADIIGLDVIKSSLDYYKSKFGENWNPPQSLIQLVNAGHLGKKTGKGWYDY
jgi:3-hydroxybutyryl-CoA dehydrogenase